MSVYIPNMKMPEHCGVCRFAVDGWCYAGERWAYKYGKPNIDALANDGRTNFCPLIPVPDHGRLIDADALDKTLQFIGEAEAQIYGSQSWGFVMKCRQALEDAPTVILAEEGE